MDATNAGPRRNSTTEPLRSLPPERHCLSVLWCLAKAGGPLHLADVARDVARLEASPECDGSAADDAGPIYVRLYHNYVPKLREAGAVSFDAESKVVSLPAGDGNVASLRDVIDPELADRWVDAKKERLYRRRRR